MPTNTNNCRLLCTQIGALAVVTGDDVLRITYTGIPGITLNVRDRYIGGDPHNYSLYQQLGMSPKDAFDHATRVFGYAPTNLKTATTKAAIASGNWAGAQTPHWNAGDTAAAHRLILSLAALGGGAVPTVSTIDAAVEKILRDICAATIGLAQNDIKAALQRHRRGTRLSNATGYIGGLAFTEAPHHLSARIGQNSHLFDAAGVGSVSKYTFSAYFNKGRTPGGGDCPVIEMDNVPRLASALQIAAEAYPLGGVLLITGLTLDQRVAASAKIAALNGAHYSAQAVAPSTYLAHQLGNLI